MVSSKYFLSQNKYWAEIVFSCLIVKALDKCVKNLETSRSRYVVKHFVDFVDKISRNIQGKFKEVIIAETILKYMIVFTSHNHSAVYS